MMHWWHPVYSVEEEDREGEGEGEVKEEDREGEVEVEGEEEIITVFSIYRKEWSLL